MATIAELEADIAKAKKNSMMPDALKKKYIEKKEKEIAAMHSTDTVKKRSDAVAEESAARDKKSQKPRKASKAEMEEAFGKEFMASKDKGAKKTYKNEGSYTDFENDVTEEIEEYGDVTRSDAQGIVEANEADIKKQFEIGATPSTTARSIMDKGTKKEKSTGAKYSPSEEDCEKIIADARAKSKKAKASADKSAAKSPAAKSTASIDKTVDAIEKKFDEGDLTKAQILKMIAKLRKEIKHLESLLTNAKN